MITSRSEPATHLLTDHFDPTRETVDVAVVIPAFNEENGVGPTIEGIRAVLSNHGCTFTIIVVDDGSTDATADRAATSGARVVRMPENRGYGAALKAGIQACHSEFIVITDADGSYPAEAIPRLLEGASEADMVVGLRHPSSAGIPTIRKPAKLVLNLIANYLSGRKIPDLNSGLRVFRRSVLDGFFPILPSGFSFTTTSTLAFLCTNHRVDYVPIEYRRRIGTSKIRPFHFFDFVILVLRTVMLFNPLKVLLPISLLLFLIGVGKLAYDITLWNLSETAVMAFLGSLVVASVGLLADMISRLNLWRPEGGR